MKTEANRNVRALGSFGRTTRALRNQPLFDGGNIVPFITQPRPGGNSGGGGGDCD